MKFSKEFNESIMAWKKENDDNRAIIVIGVERSNQQENGECDYNTGGWVIGNGGMLEDTVYHILTDSSKEEERHVLRDIFRRAISRAALDGMCRKLQESIKDIDKMMKELGLSEGNDDDDDENEDTKENSETSAEEQGKEASHE